MNDIFYIKAVDNSRIRKPVDFQLSLDVCIWVLLGFVVLGAFLLQAWQQVQIREIGYQMERVRSEAETFQQENKLLKVERAALRSPQRIDTYARANLGMMLPSQQQMLMLDATHTLGDQPVMAQVSTVDPALAARRRAAE